MQRKEFGGEGGARGWRPQGLQAGKEAGRRARETWGASLELERPVGQE